MLGDVGPDSHTSAAPVESPGPVRAKSTRCVICGSPRTHYSFSIRGTRVLQCADCKFAARTEPTARPAVSGGAEAARTMADRFGSLAAVLRQILPEGANPAAARVVDWASDSAVMIPEADGVALSVGQLDAFANPMPSLRRLHGKLRPDEPVVFVTTDIRRSGAEVGSVLWERLTGERNAYLDIPTALTLLYLAGFRCRGVRRLRRRVPLEHFLDHDVGDLVISRWRRRLLRLLPRSLCRAIHVDSRSSEVAILAVPRTTADPVVSVVVPAYNEAATVARLLDAVLGVRLDGAQIEVVVVESNSTDGTREIVQRYAGHPRVTCLFEDRPRGKGHATRRGLEQARGDILVIQDADLEYDIEDYHSLIDPIIRGHEAFVLGSRHGGRNHWKLRQFGKPVLSKFYNTAHVLVTAYINLLYGLSLRDPQTMYKVCRRDCIEGVRFGADYFNFDYELLLKIVRRGYTPLEVPVNYRARSHAEGKKIRMWRDAPLGLLMITLLRLTPLRRFLTIGERVQ